MASSSLVRGACCAIAASLMFAAMGTAVRIASNHIANEMVVFLRNAFGLLVLLPWLYLRGFRVLLTSQFLGHLVRSLSGLAAMYCFFYALAHLSLAEAMLLNFSAPLFVAPIALLWLGEMVSLLVLVAMLTGFSGIILVLKPGSGLFSSAAWVGLLSGIFSAIAMVSIRRMSAMEPALRIVFYFSAVNTVVSAIPLLWAWQTPNLTAVIAMLAAGLFATKGQLLLTHSYSLAPAAQISPYSYSTVIFATIIGWWYWHEQLDAGTLLGALLICISGALTMTRPKEPAPILG